MISESDVWWLTIHAFWEVWDVGEGEGGSPLLQYGGHLAVGGVL